MTQGFKTVVWIAIGAVVAFAVALHLFAPQYARAIGQAIHGGR